MNDEVNTTGRILTPGDLLNAVFDPVREIREPLFGEQRSDESMGLAVRASAGI
jgi:hypothetical protein